MRFQFPSVLTALLFLIFNSTACFNNSADTIQYRKGTTLPEWEERVINQHVQQYYCKPKSCGPVKVEPISASNVGNNVFARVVRIKWADIGADGSMLAAGDKADRKDTLIYYKADPEYRAFDDIYVLCPHTPNSIAWRLNCQKGAETMEAFRKTVESKDFKGRIPASLD